jgi:hypothetical protein
LIPKHLDAKGNWQILCTKLKKAAGRLPHSKAYDYPSSTLPEVLMEVKRKLGGRRAILPEAAENIRSRFQKPGRVAGTRQVTIPREISPRKERAEEGVSVRSK